MLVNDSNQILSRPCDTGIVLNTKRIIENSPLTEKTASLHSLGIFLYQLVLTGNIIELVKTKSSEHFIKPNLPNSVRNYILFRDSSYYFSIKLI